MAEEEKKPMTNLSFGTLCPGENFYILLTQGNLDGTVDTHPDGHSQNLDEITAEAIESVESYHMDVYVYECRPLRKVAHGKAKVTDLTKRK